MPKSGTSAALTIFLVVALFTLLAGDAWRYTITWWGFGVVALGIAATSVMLLARRRAHWGASSVPIPLAVFLALATLSIAWSFYPGATAIGLVTTWLTTIVAAAIAVTFTWDEFLRGLALALRFVLGLSLLFELFVALVIRRPVLPLWVDYGTGDLPKLLYWSRNELFEVFDGGRIQGVVGNASTLGFMALLALIAFGLQLAGGTVRRLPGILWIAIAVVTMYLTSSATILVALVVVAATLGAVLVVRRARGGWRVAVQSGMLAIAAVAVTLGLVFRGPLLSALGKSDDLTGRLDIWDAVIGLAQQRPVLGWGWVSYWPPWVAPFDDLISRNGVQVMHAHNAWLDVWLQLGIVGVIVVGALVISTLVRSWLFAVDPPQVSVQPGPFTAITLLPVLLLVALLVQSVAESRMLVEYGWMILVLLAIKTRTNSA
jgi:exopolysaccharide production protein ExoQ